MTKWTVRAEAYSLNVGGLREFVIKETTDVRFTMYPDSQEVYKQSYNEKGHRSTGFVTVDVEMDDANQAIDFVALKVLPWYSQTLTFAHGHHVFFHNFQAFKTGQEDLAPSGAVFHSIRVGPRHGMGPIVYLPWKIPDFLGAVIPKLRNDAFLGQTGIGMALLWYNEPVLSDMTMETEFICHWLVLETMANASAEEEGETSLLGTDRFREVREVIEEAVRGTFPQDPQVEKLLNSLGSVNLLPVRNKIGFLLSHHGLPAYDGIVRQCNDWRNDLLHGRLPDNHQAFSEDFRRITRIDEKLILKALGVYGEPYLHAALTKENLMAR